jgi:hypothetical protein
MRHRWQAEAAATLTSRTKKGRSLTEATPFAPNVTECSMQVTLHRLGGILRSCKVLMVFSGYGELVIFQCYETNFLFPFRTGG